MTAMMTASQRNRVLPRKAAAAPPLPCNGYPRVWLLPGIPVPGRPANSSAGLQFTPAG